MYEDDKVIVFLDIFPVSEGHTLVVTKTHYSDLFEADSESLEAVAKVAKKVAHALREVVRPAGLMVFQLNGSAAGQTVFHYHMHLMPRAQGEPLRLHARQPGDPTRLAELAAKLRAALQSA
ncbi:MAG: HIT family protein [Fimbriimonadales bacterium]|nr:MAG: HIT family protein [Fimbriimonadales bacterium]